MFKRIILGPKYNGFISSLSNSRFINKKSFYSNDSFHHPKPLVITGPSGVGKGTIITYMRNEYPNKFTYNVSHTTRKPREGEIDGVHYYFTDKETMIKEIEEGKFIESVNYNGNLYGTSFKSIYDSLQPNKIHIIEIDIKGCEILKKVNFDARYIFIAAPSMDVLESRLKGRKSETPESIKRRLEIANHEMSYMNKEGFFDFIIINHHSKDSYKILLEYLKDDLKD